MLFLETFQFFEKLIEPIVIIIAGLIIGRILGKLTKNLLFNFKSKSKLKVHRLGENIVKYSIYIFSIIIAIKRSGTSDIILSTILVIGFFILLLLVSLNLLDFVLDSSSYLYVRRNFKEGDNIKVSNIQGKIKKISLTKTKVKSKDNILIIPNFFIKNNYPK